MKFTVLSFVLAALSFTAHADFAKSSSTKKWSFVEETDAYLQTPTCRAFTQASDAIVPVELSMSYPKDGGLVPLITIKSTLEATGIAIKTGSKTFEPMFVLVPGTETVYWYAPTDFLALEKQIRDDSILQVTFATAGAPTVVKISLSGSSNALSLVGKCLTGEVPDDFFKQLNAQKEDLQPDLGDHSSAFLQNTIQVAYSAYKQGKDLQAALEVLRKPYARTLRKEAEAIKANDSALGKLTVAQAAVDAKNIEIAQLNGEIANSQAQLAALIAAKPSAEQDLAAKKAVYDPLKKQMQPYEARVAAAVSAVSKAQRAIDRANSAIRANQRAIRDLQEEKAQREAQLPGMRAEALAANREARDAERARNAFNPQQEYRRILDGDWFYQSNKRDLQQARDRKRDAQNDVNFKEGQLSVLRQQLQQCQQDPNADCSAQQAAVNNQQQAVQQARSQVQQAQSDIDNLQWRIQNAESDAERQVEQQRTFLENAVTSAYHRVDQAEDALNRTENRIAQIPNEIASLQREIAQYEAALPGLQADLATAQSAQAQAQADRDAFAGQIGYAAAEQAYLAAIAELQRISDGVKDLQRSIPKLQASLAKANKTLVDLQKSLTRAQAAQATTAKALADIQVQLQPLREQEAPLVTQQEQALALFKDRRAAYQIVYEELAGQPLQ